MIKNKLYSVMDEEGNLGYYLYNESTGEEKLYSVVDEEERLYANLDEEDIKFLEEHAGNKVRNARNLGTRNVIATGAKGGLALTALNGLDSLKVKPGTNAAKLIKKVKTPAAIAVGASIPASLYLGKKQREKSDEIHDKFRDLYVNSSKKERENLRKLSRKERLKLANKK